MHELYSILLLATLVCPLAKDPRSKNSKDHLVESKDPKYEVIMGESLALRDPRSLRWEFARRFRTTYHVRSSTLVRNTMLRGSESTGLQDMDSSHIEPHESLTRASNMGPRSWKCVLHCRNLDACLWGRNADSALLLPDKALIYNIADTIIFPLVLTCHANPYQPFIMLRAGFSGTKVDKTFRNRNGTASIKG